MTETSLKVRCSAVSKRSGRQCSKWAIKGGTVCSIHGGSAKQVKAKAAVRAELMSWGLTDQYIDPTEAMLKLVSQSANRAQRYAEELEALVAESPSLREALVAETWIPSEHGERHKAGEYIRALAVLEAQERDRLCNFSAKAIAAGVAQAQVRIAEQTGQLMAAMVSAALSEVSMPDDLATQFKAALARQVRAIGPGA